MKRAHIRVSGRVQGVGFRYSCVREARALGVTGWVRNCHDGSVEITAEGDTAAVDALVNWARHGPAFSQVSGIQLSESAYRGEFTTFDVMA